MPANNDAKSLVRTAFKEALQLAQILCESLGSHVDVILQEKEKWSKEKFEIANKAKSEAARLTALEQEAQDKAK